MSMTPPRKLLILAGEASGDFLGAELVRALRAQHANLQIFAMGNQQLANAGAEILVNANRLAVVGAIEILKNLKPIRQAFKTLKRFVKQQRPDCVVLIDYPGFNLRFAKIAKRLGSKVLFYVSPQIWAWRYRRVKHIRRYVDHMAVLFPFEEKIYQRENIPVTFVGHPLIDKVPSSLSKDLALRMVNLNPKRLTIALMPGSRLQEIHRLLPVMQEAAHLISMQLPNVQFVLPLAPGLSYEEVEALTTPDILVLPSHHEDVLPHCDAAIIASGTATLEMALNGVPMVIIYQVSAITFQLAKWLVKVKYIGLCNIVANKMIATELLQTAVTAQAISQEVVRLVRDKAYRDDITASFANLRSQLGHPGVSQRVADLVNHLSNPTSTPHHSSP